MLDHIVEKHGITQINGAFQDIDAYKEAVEDWELDISQLAKGLHHASLFHATHRDISFLAFSHSIHSEHIARATNQGLSIFLLDSMGEGTFSLFGKEASIDYITISPQHSNLYTVTPNNTRAFSFSLDYSRLELVAQYYMGERRKLTIPKEASVFQANPLVIDALRNALRQLHILMRCVQCEEHVLAVDEFIDQYIVTLILQILVGDTLGSRKIPIHQNRLTNLLSIINNNLDSPPSISELATQLDITPRTIQYLFNQGLGVTPKAYIKAKRLEATRRKLATTKYSRGAVADADNHFGFWHMGQFSKDFKEQFGYLPTTTLQKT